VLVEDETSGYLMTYEQISFTYQHIQWVYVDGGYVSEDDWETPVA
jgi:type VI protein secretion system component Hcp